MLEQGCKIQLLILPTPRNISTEAFTEAWAATGVPVQDSSRCLQLVVTNVVMKDFTAPRFISHPHSTSCNAAVRACQDIALYATTTRITANGEWSRNGSLKEENGRLRTGVARNQGRSTNRTRPLPKPIRLSNRRLGG